MFKIYHEHWIFRFPFIRMFLRKTTGMYLFGILLKHSKKYYINRHGVNYLRELIKHETFHGWQVIMCGGFINFLCLYVWWFIIGLIKYRNFKKAYKNIYFEIKAREYQNESIW